MARVSWRCPTPSNGSVRPSAARPIHYRQGYRSLLDLPEMGGFGMDMNKEFIRLGAKVSTAEGTGVVVGILHTEPSKYDVRLLADGRVLLYLTERQGLKLIS